MENFMYLALCFFVLAIFFGFIIFIQLLCGRPSFKPAVIIHGLVAILGLSCLITYAILHTGSKPWLSIGILVLAAMGGLTLLSFDLRKKPVPKAILLLHPIAALTGLGLLIYYLIA
ncbi:MAG: hypothetical protein ACO1N3_04280 [Gammaproteobacteria bacterium]